MYPECQALCKAFSTVQVWIEAQGEMLLCRIMSLGPSLSYARCFWLLCAVSGIQDIQYLVHRVACSDLTREGFHSSLNDSTLVREGWLKQPFFLSVCLQKFKEQLCEVPDISAFSLPCLTVGNRLYKLQPEAQLGRLTRAVQQHVLEKLFCGVNIN